MGETNRVPAAPLDSADPRGVYGLRLRGLDGARDLLAPACATWPALSVTWRTGDTTDEQDAVWRDRAEIGLQGGGRATLDRQASTATFVFPDAVEAGAIVHPFLSMTAALFNWWLGREPFHAGAFVVDGGAWIVLGDKGAGKSSTLGWLATCGVPVISDDVVVLDGSTILPGPACIDLRPDAAERLGVGDYLGVVGVRERCRVRTDPSSPVPLRGFLALRWGADLKVEPVPVADRIALLLGARALRLPPSDPARVLDLAGLPAYEVLRPRGWDSMGAMTDRLLAVLRRAG